MRCGCRGPGCHGGDVAAAVGLGDGSEPAVAEVTGADDLLVAVGGGEALAGLAGALEGGAVGLVHDGGGGAVQVGPVEIVLAGLLRGFSGGLHGCERGGLERRALGPDAGVDVADDDALAGLGGTAEGGPQTLSAGEAEEVGGALVVGGVVELVGGDLGDAVGGGQPEELAGVELGAEGVGGDGVVLTDGGADLLGDTGLFVDQMGAVALGVGGGDVESLACGGSGGGDVGDAAVVGDEGLVGEGDQVRAGSKGVLGRRRWRGWRGAG